ncbi:hypothetical protein EES43_28995 [Streptomyces sp. ADI96-02]|nr:hypothetical protein EES43_28995 [Streptomyces sp. ADI96-02]
MSMNERPRDIPEPSPNRSTPAADSPCENWAFTSSPEPAGPDTPPSIGPNRASPLRSSTAPPNDPIAAANEPPPEPPDEADTPAALDGAAEAKPTPATHGNDSPTATDTHDATTRRPAETPATRPRTDITQPHRQW